MLLPLHGIEGSSVELIAAAADADGRAAMYGEPLHGLTLASPISVSCLLCVSTQGFVFWGTTTRLPAVNASLCAWLARECSHAICCRLVLEADLAIRMDGVSMQSVPHG